MHDSPLIGVIGVDTVVHFHQYIDLSKGSIRILHSGPLRAQKMGRLLESHWTNDSKPFSPPKACAVSAIRFLWMAKITLLVRLYTFGGLNVNFSV